MLALTLRIKNVPIGPRSALKIAIGTLIRASTTSARHAVLFGTLSLMGLDQEGRHRTSKVDCEGGVMR